VPSFSFDGDVSLGGPVLRCENSLESVVSSDSPLGTLQGLRSAVNSSVVALQPLLRGRPWSITILTLRSSGRFFGLPLFGQAFPSPEEASFSLPNKFERSRSFSNFARQRSLFQAVVSFVIATAFSPLFGAFVSEYMRTNFLARTLLLPPPGKSSPSWDPSFGARGN